MSQTIGVLLDRSTLTKGVRGRKTVEAVPLYRAIARDDLGIDVVLFSIEDVKGSRLRGYVPTQKGWRRVRLAVPKVVHKRVLYRTSGPLRKVRALDRRGVCFVNPFLMQNKAEMNRLLRNDEATRPHLPETKSYSWSGLVQMLDEGVATILKPQIGSVGAGIVRLVPLGDGRIEVTATTRRVLSRSALRRWLRSGLSARRYLLQSYIPLATYDGRPFDLRVPVQRDGDGRWSLSGAVAKVARRHPFLTNAGRGGKVMPGELALEHAFPDRADDVLERVGRLAIDVARAVAHRYPFAADLGLDIGVDRDGNPWLIEVNTRDQRYTFREAGMTHAFRALYRNPLAYCAHLNEILSSGKSWSPPD